MRALAIAVALLAAAGTVQAAAKPAHRAAKPAPAPVQAAATARSVLDSWEQSIPFLKAVEAAYPAETLAQAQIYVDKSKAGASAAELQQVASDVVQAMVIGPRYFLATAPTDKLVAYAQASASALPVFKAKSDHACAFPDAEFQADPASYATNPMSAAMIAAINAGRDTPVHRDAPTQADNEAYSKAIVGTASPAALNALRNPSAPRTDAINCDIATASFKALAAMPPESAARVMASSMTAGTHPPAGASAAASPAGAAPGAASAAH
jgi:hypothetical protein